MSLSKFLRRADIEIHDVRVREHQRVSLRWGELSDRHGGQLLAEETSASQRLAFVPSCTPAYPAVRQAPRGLRNPRLRRFLGRHSGSRQWHTRCFALGGDLSARALGGLRGWWRSRSAGRSGPRVRVSSSRRTTR
jgi:hypothetical protein